MEHTQLIASYIFEFQCFTQLLSLEKQCKINKIVLTGTIIKVLFLINLLLIENILNNFKNDENEIPISRLIHSDYITFDNQNQRYDT